jgi:hypothetical protein
MNLENRLRDIETDSRIVCMTRFRRIMVCPNSTQDPRHSCAGGGALHGTKPDLVGWIAVRRIRRSLRQPGQSQALYEPDVVRGPKRPDPILEV